MARIRKPQHQLFVWLGIAALALVATAIIYFTVLRNRIATHTASIQDALLTIQLNTLQSQNYSDLSKQVETIQSQANQLNQNFFDHTKALAFVEYIENLAAQLNVTQDLKLGDPAQLPAGSTSTFVVTEKDFTLNLTGLPANLLRFLAALDANPAYLLINSLSIDRNIEGVSHLILTGAIPWQ